MSLEKRQILPLVKPIIAISVCIVIFSITWILQDQDKQEEAGVENSGVTAQDQVAGTTTAGITNDSDEKDQDTDKADSSIADGNSGLNTLPQTVLSIDEYNEGKPDEENDSGDDSSVTGTASAGTAETTPTVEATLETDDEPEQADNGETTHDDGINSTLSELTNSIQKTTDKNQQDTGQQINTNIVNNQQDTGQQNSSAVVSDELTSSIPIDAIESTSEVDSQQEKIGNEKTNTNASSNPTLSALAGAAQLVTSGNQQKNDSNPDSNSALSALAEAAQLVTGGDQQKNGSNSDSNSVLSTLAGAAQLVAGDNQQKNDSNSDNSAALSALAGALELATRSAQTGNDEKNNLETNNNETQISEASLSSTTTVDALVSEQTAMQILSSIKAARPDLPIDNLRYSNIEGIYKATLQDSTVFFSGDGQFFIIGDMYQVKGKQLINLQEEKRRKEEAAFAPQRAKMLDAVPLENMVIFPSIVSRKAYVYVFTDIDCGFCRKLHGQIPELQTQGIEVRYLAFPRAGVDSISAQKLATIWCADNPREAMTLFKQEKNLDIAPCEPNPVADHYKLGQDIGILGTPSIVLSSGQIVSGAPSAEQLIAIMKEANLY